ncbi:hypothetical protein ACVIRO_006571 [Rhizobium ruizarguesonis]
MRFNDTSPVRLCWGGRPEPAPIAARAHFWHPGIGIGTGAFSAAIHAMHVG